MELIISTAIGGQVMEDPNINIRVINIALSKEIKQQFEEIEFENLKKVKVNLYISGDVSEYCDETGISKNKYSKVKKEVSSEFCINRNYWKNNLEKSTEQKLKDFVKNSLMELGDFMRTKLKEDGFNYEKYIEIIKGW
ncbi:Imm12 family immunity protein [Sphingobacterium spiritivorum]|uniref:Imm12 family immunity protein n=1 Tax=Sphingobacterium spiritivorum TaxID=258 RepID=UPI003DA641B9